MRRLVLLAGLLAGPVPARAQEVPARLTLEEALRIARASNPAFLQAAGGADVAAAQERQAWGQFLPSVSTSLSFRGAHSRALTGTGDFGEIKENPEYVETTNSNTSQGLALNLTLFDGAANLNTLRARRAGVRAADAGVAAAALQLRHDVSAAFYQALQAQRTLRVEEALLRSAVEQLEMTRQRFRIGSANREDVLGAEAFAASREQALLRARGEVEKARLRLLRQLGVSRAAGFEVVGDLPPVFDPAALDAEALVRAALASSPRALQREAELRAAELGAGAARGLRWPRITADFSYGRSVGRPEYDAFFELDPPNTGWSFGLQFSLPLFSRFQTSSQIAQAEAQAESARQSLRAERLTVETETRQALVDLTNAHRIVELADRALALSQERLELTQERYRTGTGVSFIELQSAIDQAAAAERQAIDARFGFVTALINLEAKVGREVRP